MLCWNFYFKFYKKIVVTSRSIPTVVPLESLKCWFMKQNCHFQNSVLQFKNATKPLQSSGIHMTHYHFQTRYISLFLLMELKSSQPSEFECLYFLSKTHFTFLLWLITLEHLEQKQSNMPLLKLLMCGMNASGSQFCGHISISCYTHLKLELLLHKTVLVTFLLASTVCFAVKIGVKFQIVWC